MKFELKSSVVTLFVLLAALLAGPKPAGAQTNGLRVLFLGDRAGHKPAERFAILQPVFAKKNIEVTYTESMQDINPTNLAKFDCLMIYANTTRITPEQETAMLDFVAAGGGFVPIHCASYCFLNSPKYIELVGGQFKSHETGVFKETIIKSDHPIMKGLSPIESWDETYVHTKHNTNRVVLAERRDDSGAEPYTWVRDHGKGRVFYTAWGHDQRTWNNADFQALLENGTRWASENSPSLTQRRAATK
jgi:type 1 glutamine amidotransferase